MIEWMTNIVIVVTILLCIYVGITSKNILFVVATAFIGVIGGAIVVALLTTSPVLAGGAAFLLLGGLWYFIRSTLRKAKIALALAEKDNGLLKTLGGVYWGKPHSDSHASFVILRKNKVGFVAGHDYDKTADDARERFAKSQTQSAPITATMSYTIMDYDADTRQYALAYDKDEKPSRFFTANEDGTITIDFGDGRDCDSYSKIA